MMTLSKAQLLEDFGEITATLDLENREEIIEHKKIDDECGILLVQGRIDTLDKFTKRNKVTSLPALKRMYGRTWTEYLKGGRMSNYYQGVLDTLSAIAEFIYDEDITEDYE